MDAEQEARKRLANNGRNPANKNAGIRVGSDLHLCEMLLYKLDRVRTALAPFAQIALARDADSDAQDMINGPDLSITPAQVRAARAAIGQEQ